jgi:hypothetical protein
MTELLAYALREELAGTVVQYETQKDKDAGNGVEVPAFTGGVIAAGERDVDVRDLLDADPHPGVIIVDPADTALVNALEAYPALKRVAAPDGDVQPIDELEAETVTRLRHIARVELGLDGAARANKPALVEAIRAKRAALAEAATGSEADKLRASELTSVEDATDHADRREGDA